MKQIRLMAIVLACVVAQTVYAQDSWTNIAPGSMDRATIMRVLGPSYQVQQTFNGQNFVWFNELGARQIRVTFVNDTVDQVVVVPATAMTEADVERLYGGASVGAGQADDGNRLQNYPVAGATVEFTSNGQVAEITLDGGMSRNGAQATAEKALQTQLMNMITGKKKGGGGATSQ